MKEKRNNNRRQRERREMKSGNSVQSVFVFTTTVVASPSFLLSFMCFFSSALPSYVSFAILPVCPLSLRFRLLLRFSFNSFE